jgi:hypothetical protein
MKTERKPHRSFLPEEEPIWKVRSGLAMLVGLFGATISAIGVFFQSQVVYVVGWPFLFICIAGIWSTALQYTFGEENGFRKKQWKDRNWQYW